MPKHPLMGRAGLAGVVSVVLLAVCGGVAHAQTYSATVTRVVDGDTLEARVADGRVLPVRLIGIDTPETNKPGTPVECGGPQATESLEELVLNQNVNLVADPTQGATDAYDRYLFYVDRVDGLDVGLTMIQRGWSRAYVYDEPFQRLGAYSAAESQAEDDLEGAWFDCDGDFHSGQQDEAEAEQERAYTARAFVRRYYRRLSNGQYRSAWAMQGARRKAQVRPYRSWKAGFKGSLTVAVLGTTARLSRGRAVVGVRLRSRDRDACRRGGVRQDFRGSVTLAPKRGSWVIMKFGIRKTSGQAPRTSRSQCPAPRQTPPPNGGGGGGGGCHPSYPDFCIAPAPPDLDCSDVNGTDFTVRGEDPHGFDGEGDGRGCES